MKGEAEEKEYSEECNFDVGTCGWKIRTYENASWSLLDPLKSQTGKF